MLDKKTLIINAGKIKPQVLISYILMNKWVEISIKRNDIKIFQYKYENDYFEQIIIPMNNELYDFNLAMYEAIKTLAEVEKKDIEQFIYFLYNPNVDIIKIRMQNDETKNGSIPINIGFSFYENIKNLIISTLEDIIEPKKNHRGKKSLKVHKILSNYELGQTEIGSYVVSIILKFEDDMTPENKLLDLNDMYKDSFTRQLTCKLMKNINHIKQSIDDDKLDNLISYSNENNISINFYEALNGLNLKNKNVNVEFQTQWSPFVHSNKYEKDKIKLSHYYYSYIEKVIKELKKDEDEEVTITGFVTKLGAAPELRKRNLGNVTISYADIDDDNKYKQITIKVSPNDYNLAIDAHKNGKIVEAIVLKRENSNSMKCIDFKVLT